MPEPAEPWLYILQEISWLPSESTRALPSTTLLPPRQSHKSTPSSVSSLILLHLTASLTHVADLNTVAFHPDGHLLGLASPGLISLYHTKTLEFAASFSLPTTLPTTSLSFSENGIWFAAAYGTSVTVFDVRKEGEAAILKTFDSSAEVRDVSFDYSGQFLASVGRGGVEVRAYRKKEKMWEEPLQVGVPGEGLAWGTEAGKLVTVSREGVVTVLAASA